MLVSSAGQPDLVSNKARCYNIAESNRIFFLPLMLSSSDSFILLLFKMSLVNEANLYERVLATFELVKSFSLLHELLAGLLDAIAKDEDIKNNSEEIQDVTADQDAEDVEDDQTVRVSSCQNVKMDEGVDENEEEVKEDSNENKQSVRVDENENVKEENHNKDAKNEEYECECEDALICLCSSSTSIADSNGLSDSVDYEWDDEFTALSNVSGNKEHGCEPADEIEVTFAKLNSCEIMRPFNNGLVDTNQNELPFNSLYTAGIITEDQYEQDTSTTTLQKVTGYDLDTFYNERNSAMGCSLPSHVATVFMMDHTNHGPNVAAHNDDFDWDLYCGLSASELPIRSAGKVSRLAQNNGQYTPPGTPKGRG